MENNSIGEKIKIRRKELNLTLNELSKKSGVALQLISDYENSRKEPGIKNIKLLANALNVYPSFFVDDNHPYSFEKKNNYGALLYHYLEALKMSKEDELIISKDKKEVTIKINDEILKTIFVQIEDFLKDRESKIYETIENFNVNILSDKEIKK